MRQFNINETNFLIGSKDKNNFCFETNELKNCDAFTVNDVLRLLDSVFQLKNI